MACQTIDVDNINAPDNSKITFQTQWNMNPYSEPAMVNQVLMTEGVGTQFGSDGLVYLFLGHVSPPAFGAEMVVNEDNEAVLQVNTVGHFGLTIERAKELHGLLTRIIEDVEAKREGEFHAPIN